jgi:dephospho-CoA kinase
MKVYGLTGGIGMGKSTAGSILAKLGCRVVDTDVIARELTEPGQPALIEIRQAFGDECFGPGDRLRRDVLARRVFASESDRRQLEGMLHPRIRAKWMAQVESWRNQAVPTAVVIIPLLFETDAAQDLDLTVCVACSEALQQRRLSDRGWTTEQIQQRIQAQMPVRRKIGLADYVVWNCAGLDVLEAQLARILAVQDLTRKAKWTSVRPR